MVPKPQPRATSRGGLTEWFAQHPSWLLALATLLVLLPFAGKPFSTDDPLFIWVARQIHLHPANPYGFSANWYGYDWPFWDIMKNPPLAGYYLAVAGGIFGWSEVALHAACLLPALAVVLGAYRLATRMCGRPLLAGFLTLFAPVFLVSSTTLMCDVPMLAFWIWALVFWVEGTERKRPGLLAMAALLMGLSALTKYFGACLLPLVVVWSVARKRPVREWLGWLAIPVAMLVAYQLATRALYGHGLLTNASESAVTIRGSSALLNLKSLLTTLAFTGGCLAAVTFFAPLLWGRRQLILGAIGCFVLTGILFFAVRNMFPSLPDAAEALQILLWASGGIGLIALAAVDVWRQRDADSLLLACWIVGTFIFTAFINWGVNARSILPMTIPAAILVARRLEQRAGAGVKFSTMAVLAPVAAVAALAIWLAVTDYFLAAAQQTMAEAVHSSYGNSGHRMWFQGHWGFQYYMEKNGAKALDLQHLKLTEGDYIAMPSGNANVYPLKEPVTQLETFSIPPFGGLTIMDKQTGAGFHAAVWGPLPFAFGSGAEQSVTVFAYDPTGEIQKSAAQKGK